LCALGLGGKAMMPELLRALHDGLESGATRTRRRAS
jgi:hypothetical protein